MMLRMGFVLLELALVGALGWQLLGGEFGWALLIALALIASIALEYRMAASYAAHKWLTSSKRRRSRK